MDSDVPPDSHGDSRARIDAVKPRLDPAPNAESRGEIAVHRTSEREAPIGEEITALETHDSRLRIAVEQEAPRHALIVNAALGEQCERVAPSAIFAQRLPPLGGHPDWKRSERLYADSQREFAAAAADVGAAAQDCRKLRRDIVEEPRAGLAAPKRSAACQ